MFSRCSQSDKSGHKPTDSYNIYNVNLLMAGAVEEYFKER